MGNDCFKQNKENRTKQSNQNEGTMRLTQNKRVNGESRQINQSSNKNIQLRKTRDRQSAQISNRLSRVQDLQRKRQAMVEKQKLGIKQKEQSIIKVNQKIEQLTSSGPRDDLKLAKLQRELKVLQDCIRQHERNIQKIKQADSLISTQ